MEKSDLAPGDRNYKAYVGPPGEFDVMGATQFRLLCALGLRAGSSVLDVGCGSLRAGKLLIAYLNEGRYFGIEPNEWLVADAIENEIGAEQIRIKQPAFDPNAEFDTTVFGRRFDFIIAQSIFSHTGPELVRKSLASFAKSLEPNGVIAVTFVEGRKDFDGDGWVYPGSVMYRRSTIAGFAREAGLNYARIPWYHPRQRWYLMAKTPRRLPTRLMMRHLSGGVLLNAELVVSWSLIRRVARALRTYVRNARSK